MPLKAIIFNNRFTFSFLMIYCLTMKSTNQKIVDCIEKWQEKTPTYQFQITFNVDGTYEIQWQNGRFLGYIRLTKYNPEYQYTSSHDYEINRDFMECLGLTEETCKFMM